MELTPFKKVLAVAKGVSPADREWFPRWLSRYAQNQQVVTNDPSIVIVSRQLAIRFSQELLAKGLPAWQRLQAVYPLAADLHLQNADPSPTAQPAATSSP